MQKTQITLHQWWHEVGTENVLAVIADVGTSLAYMRALTYRSKRPGYDLAVRIAAAAQRLTPGSVPSVELMMTPIAPKEPSGRARGGNIIPPSSAYLKREARL